MMQTAELLTRVIRVLSAAYVMLLRGVIPLIWWIVYGINDVHEPGGISDNRIGAEW
jgi:hypothetical protein